MGVPDQPGNFPEMPAGVSVKTPGAPIELPRLVMRAALAVAVAAWLLALLLGLWRAREDMRDEIDGALVLARISALMAEASAFDDAALVAALGRLHEEGGARHLHVRLIDAQGRDRFVPPEEPRSPSSLRWLVALNNQVFTPPAPRSVTMRVLRGEQAPWQLQWTASPDAEQREALETLLESQLWLAACGALMLLAMRWRLKRAFRPLAPLLAAIARVEHRDLDAVRALPPMTISELEAIAAALRHLAGSLDEAEATRRQLAAQVLTLQEDERSRLARELHDEFGQHLTALRVDAAWLQRRLGHEPELAVVVAGMAQQCERIQGEIRSLLTRLRPLGADGEHETAGALQGLLAGLVASWDATARGGTQVSLAFEASEPDQRVPRERALAVYRMSQEALTNVARHAQATRAWLRVRIEPDTIHWSCEDDGVGLLHAGALQQGNGLAGLKERVWSAGGDLQVGGGHGGRGLHLQARLPLSSDAATRPHLAPRAA